MVKFIFNLIVLFGIWIVQHQCRSIRNGDGVELTGAILREWGYTANTTEMNLINRGIKSIEPFAFSYFGSLLHLTIEDQQLTTLKQYSFFGIDKLASLTVRNCPKLTRVPSGAFSFVYRLKQVSMISNGISVVEPGAFGSLDNLVSLSFYDNAITKLDVGLLERIPALTSLNLGRNQVEKIADSAFDKIDSLRELDLSFNRLSSLSSRVLKNLGKSLQTLDVSENRIDTIEAFTFKGLDKMRELNMRANPIREIKSNAFSGMNLSTLNLLDISEPMKVARDAFEGLCVDSPLLNAQLENEFGSFNDGSCNSLISIN